MHVLICKLLYCTKLHFKSFFITYLFIFFFSGIIHYVDEDTATTWLSCVHCGSEIENSYVKYCSTCRVRDPPVKSHYFMEIGIQNVEECPEADIRIKVKLYHLSCSIYMYILQHSF